MKTLEVALIVKQEWASNIIHKVEYVNDRLLWGCGDFDGIRTVIFSVYAPVEDSKDDVINDFMIYWTCN